MHAGGTPALQLRVIGWTSLMPLERGSCEWYNVNEVLK